MMTVLCIAFVSACAWADEPKPTFTPVGLWEGALDLGAIKLRLRFKIEKTDDSKFKGTWDSVDQGANGMALATITFADGELKFDAPQAKGNFAGKPAADGTTITGTWKQSGHEFPLEIKRVEKASELKRPQKPAKPFPYVEEEVVVENPAAKDVKLAGTLTLPNGAGPFPAVVLISGSGPQDRDETLMGHQPFLVLADHLTRQGIAVLRFDDRGVGKSTGVHATATSADFATDAYACVKFLMTRKKIDAKRIGLAGHSEGGIIAPMIAAEHPDDIGFIILLAGTGLRGDQVLIDQSRALVKAMKTEEKTAELTGRMQSTVMKAAAADGADPKSIADAAKSFLAGLNEDERRLLDADKLEKQDKTYAALTTPWFRFFLRHDPQAALRTVRCRVLALNGELDLQVTPKENLPAITAALKAGGNKDVTIKEFPGLNHLFQHCKTGMPTEYGDIEETISPEVLDVIANWILKTKP